ncbi:MAG: SGNH/GDSL hydrolase family protein [Acidobacteria bacterium]|nr:SGNH/GDSL hydrolase family protein [Acidobacteriota bacterium]
MNHLVLLGDSILDNSAWAYNGPEMCVHLRELVAEDWQVTLLAVDGHTTQDVVRQLELVPTTASFLVISAGGNNALRYLPVLMECVTTTAEAMEKLYQIIEEFEIDYLEMLTAAQSFKCPVAVCTVYNPRFPDPKWQQAVLATLALFNDCIVRCAVRINIPVIDLRMVCTEETDFTNAIEPSAQGGRKIAGAIATMLRNVEFHTNKSEIFGVEWKTSG